MFGAQPRPKSSSEYRTKVWHSHEFKIRTPKEPKRYLQSLCGGVLMGYSASLGIGCTIGAFFSAIPSFSLSGWLFGISLGLGAYLGTKLIKVIG